MIKIPTLLLASLTLLSGAAAQRVYLNPPEEAWTTVGGEVRPGNGLFIDPTGDALVGSFFDGSLIMFNAKTGEKIATYTPDIESGSTVRGYGGVTFSYTGPQSYLVYAITENPFGIAETRVFAVSPSGDKILETAAVPGIQSGTPLTTYDGRYILMNSNLDDQGYFSVFDTSEDTGSPIEPVYQFTGNMSAPFGPLGGFLQPAEGYYDGGEGNTNDFFAWGTATPENATAAGMGQVYAFQMPMDDSEMSAFPLGSSQAFEMSTPPVFANEGRSMYLATTKAEQRCWIGTAGDNRSRFNRGRTETIGLTRGNPQYLSASAPPSFGGDSATPTVYGPGAAAEVWAATYNYSMFVSVPTSDIISSKVAVSPDNTVIYYATQDGLLVQADSASLATLWNETFSAGLEGEIAINEKGTMVYACDTSGIIKAFTVSEGDATTAEPTSQPTITPSPTTVAPTGVPTVAPAPTKAPSIGDSASGGAPSAASPTANADSGASRVVGSVTAALVLLLGLFL